MKAIVGLGNPGDKYNSTRHNLGWWCIDAIADKFSSGSWKVDIGCAVKEISISGNRILLVKPMRFMNLSGQAAGPLLRYYKIAIEDTLVIHDDVDLSVAQLRLRRGGGHGGQNGVRDLIAHVGADFMRLRVGIGRPEDKHQMTSWVLGSPSKDEFELYVDAVNRVIDVVTILADGSFQKAQEFAVRGKYVTSRPL